jgi:hypothetical protein
MVLLADIGVPMISLILPAAWLLLIPVIFVEALIGIRVAKIPFRRSLAVATTSNIFSTLLGVPLAWLAMVLVEGLYFGEAKGLDSLWAKIYAVTVQSPWLIPYEKDLVWMVPIAGVVLAIPLCLMSIVSEYFITKLMLPELPSTLKWQWMWKANVASYLFLLAVILALPVLGPLVNWFYILLQPVTEFLIELVMKIA